MSRRIRSLPAVPVVVAAGTAVAFFVAPLVALGFRTPWSSVPDLIREPEVREALRLSLVCSLGATGLSILFGGPLAWLLARVAFPGRSVVHTLTTVSLVLPPVVSGVALLLAFGRRGVIGRFLYDWWGVQIPFTTWGVILAERIEQPDRAAVVVGI